MSYPSYPPITHVIKTKSGLSIPVTRNESIFWLNFATVCDNELKYFPISDVAKGEFDSLEIIRMELDLALTHSENLNKAKQAQASPNRNKE